MERLANGTRHREARDGCRLASPRLSPVLDVEKSPPHRPSNGAHGCPRLESSDVARQLVLGAPRLHGELLKLGVDVSQATVAKYMAHRTTPPSQSWRSFLTNHLRQIAAADFFVVPTATCRLLFVLVILRHERRRIAHVAVTAHPRPRGRHNNSAKPVRGISTRDNLVHDRDAAFYA
jgi:hypothetical protein